MKIKNIEKLHEAYGKNVWYIKEFINRKAIVFYYNNEVTLMVGNFIWNGAFEGYVILKKYIGSYDNTKIILNKIIKLVNNLPIELLDMILKLKGY